MANNSPNNFVFWTGGSAGWFSVGNPVTNAPGWVPNGSVAIPDIGTDAIALQQNITIALAAGDAVAQSLSMQGGSTGLSETSALLDMEGGSLVLARGSPVGNIAQFAGTLRFRNGLAQDQLGQQPVTDFLHPGVAGASSTIFNLVQGAGGTILVDSGELHLIGGASSIAGKIGGKDTLADPVAGVVKLVVNGTATLQSSAVLDVDEFDVVGTGATLILGGDRTFGATYVQGGVNQTVDLQGHTFTLTGPSAIGGGVTGPGTVVLKGATTMTGTSIVGGAALNVEGQVTHTTGFFNSIAIGKDNADTASLNIGATGVWTVVKDGVAGFTLLNSATFSNDGLFKKANGAGTLDIIGGIVNSTGTFEVDAGVLGFRSGTGKLGGHLTGAGEIVVGGDGGDYVLANGIKIDAAKLTFGGTGADVTLDGDVAYSATFRQDGVAYATHLNGHTFTLAGTADLRATIDGPGFMLVTGTANVQDFIVTDGATLQVAGTADQKGGVNIGVGAAVGAVAIVKGGTWNILSNASLTLGDAGTLDNDGVLRKLVGGGTSTISGSALHNGDTGLILAASGTLRRFGAVENDGSVQAAGGALLDLRDAVTGDGLAIIGNNSRIAFGGSVGAGQTVLFAANANSQAEIDAPGLFDAKLSGFNAGDTLLLGGTDAVDASVLGPTLFVTRDDGQVFDFALATPTAGGLTIDIKNADSLIGYATTAVFAGQRAGYDVLTTLDANARLSTQVTDVGGFGDGTHRLVGYQQGQFVNGTFALPQLQQIGGTLHVVGFADNDAITGNDANNALDGGAGNDTLSGRAGNDNLNGGAGDDRFVAGGAAGAGDDSLIGGVGIDTADYSANGGPTRVNLTLTTSQNTGSSGNDTLSGVENLVGGSGADTFSGNQFANTFTGGLGADELHGGSGDDILDGQQDDDLVIGDAGNDTVSGGEGIDRLYGGSGEDQLFGGAAADSLSGGPQVDRLDGGDGADRLYADATADTFVFGSLAGAGDRVFGFQSGVHTLEIDAAGFGGTAGAFDFVSNANPNPTSATQAFLYDTDNGRLFFDADGNGAGGRVYVGQLLAPGGGVPVLAATDIDLL